MFVWWLFLTYRCFLHLFWLGFSLHNFFVWLKITHALVSRLVWNEIDGNFPCWKYFHLIFTVIPYRSYTYARGGLKFDGNFHFVKTEKLCNINFYELFSYGYTLNDDTVDCVQVGVCQYSVSHRYVWSKYGWTILYIIKIITFTLTQNMGKFIFWPI